MKSYDEILEVLKKYNQEHLVKYYDELNTEEQENLLSQIERIDFEYMNELFNANHEFDMKENKITSVPAIEKKKLDLQKYEAIGAEKIKNGELAICSMAGGQGTRLGHSGPKGTLMLDLDKPTSIFETIAIKLKEAHKKYEVLIYWYVMTSEQNDEETQNFFIQNNFFGYDKEYIIFFSMLV